MSAPRRVTTRAALERLAAAPELAKSLEKLGLLVPVARALKRGPLYYDEAVRPLVERAVALTAAGYAPKDIALVLGRMAGAKNGAAVDVFPLARLAAAARLDEVRVVAWVERGLVTPWAVDESGAALFTRDALAEVRGLAALEAVGLGALAPGWADDSLDLAAVRVRVAETLAAARLLTRLVAKKAAAAKKRPAARARTPRVLRPTRRERP
ncbi:MAG: hypothetical protein U1F43_18120 [Myxococcota bacterium]